MSRARPGFGLEVAARPLRARAAPVVRRPRELPACGARRCAGSGPGEREELSGSLPRCSPQTPQFACGKATYRAVLLGEVWELSKRQRKAKRAVLAQPGCCNRVIPSLRRGNHIFSCLGSVANVCLTECWRWFFGSLMVWVFIFSLNNLFLLL